MTENEWLRAKSPVWGLDYLSSDGHYHNSGLNCNRTAVGRRKLRLYLCGCVRRVWESVPEAQREAVALGERLAEGEDVAEFIAALPEERDRSGPLSRRHAAHAARVCVETNIRYAAAFGSQAAARVAGWKRVEESGVENMHLYDPAATAEGQEQVALLRDVFGNPFRPLALDRQWLTDTVKSLARGIYHDRTFDQLPILADALMDAGCENPDILDHCRSHGPHIRGCWAVDLILQPSRAGARA